MKHLQEYVMKIGNGLVSIQNTQQDPLVLLATDEMVRELLDDADVCAACLNDQAIARVFDLEYVPIEGLLPIYIEYILEQLPGTLHNQSQVVLAATGFVGRPVKLLACRAAVHCRFAVITLLTGDGTAACANRALRRTHVAKLSFWTSVGQLLPSLYLC